MMKNTIMIFCILTLFACGKDGKDGRDGLGSTSMGVSGPDKYQTGIDFIDIEAGLVCANGGVSIFTYKDLNGDGAYQGDEESILKVKAICHGLNGTNGSNGVSSIITLESVAMSEICPQGGVKISSNTSNSVEVCNGVDGLNGEQGIPGVQGIPGIAGTDGKDGTPGTSVVPVKFCATDNSTFPEYGLMIGDELFAVYWGPTSASPKKSQAFLTKLVPGNYQSTGGDNCLFRIE